MNLKQVIFSDGVIEHIDISESTAVMSFRDYRDTSLRIRFERVVDIEAADCCCGLSVFKSNIERVADNSILSLFDDDNESMLRIEFSKAIVEFVG